MHSQLKTIIERYTPTILDVLVPASPDEIAHFEMVAGALPESYRDFLSWMGNSCPFLDGEALAYSLTDLLEIYEDPEDAVPDGFILIGIDTSGSSFDVHIRSKDGAIVRLSEYYEAVTYEYILLENTSLASFLLTTYVRTTLVPSHSFHLAAAFSGDDVKVQEFLHRVDKACGYFDISYPIDLPDFRFYGGDDFVVGLHQRPKSSIVYLYVGTIERTQYEVWYDLVFDRWKLMRMPI